MQQFFTNEKFRNIVDKTEKKKIKPQEIIRLATTNLNKTKFEKYGLKKKMFMFRNVQNKF